MTEVTNNACGFRPRTLGGRTYRDLASHYFAVCAALLLAAAAFGSAQAAEEPGTPVLRRVEVLASGGTEEVKSGAATKGAYIDLEVIERPLKQVVDYLSTVSNVNIRALKDKDNKLLVTFKLERVTYRAILDFIARKYGMIVDDSQLRSANIIYLDTPEKVSMVFQNANIRDVINTIAIQAAANIVVGPEVIGEVSMRLENVPWQEALGIVVRTLNFVVVTEPNNTIRITSPEKIAQQLDVRIFRLAYVSPEGSRYTAVLTSEFATRESGKAVLDAGQSLIEVLGKVKTAQGSISFEKRSNALVVRDTATVLDQMQNIIDKLDIPPKQVHVSLKVVELDDSDTERLGVNWNQGLQFAFSPLTSWSSAFPFDVSSGLSHSLLGNMAVASAPRRAVDPLTNTVAGTTDVFSLRNAVSRGAGGLAGFSPNVVLGSMGFQSTSALLEMFRTKTNGRIIQAPQLIALDNEDATIQVGELVRFAESFVANTEGGGNVSGFREASGSPIKLGLQLLIIPHVTGPENNILMTIIPKTEDFSLARSGAGEALPGFQRFIGPGGIELDLPQTNQRIVVTKMMLRNGETGVIGGLRQEREDLSEVKVPVFGEIPFLGRLFKHRSRSVTGTNLMIFVTPTIIDLQATDQFKKDLDKLRQDTQKPFTTLGEEEETGGAK